MGKRVDIKPLPSLERLNELFAYDKETGALMWKTIPAGFKRAKVGDAVGTIRDSGYRVVGIEKRYYLVHRIIWKMVTGEDPVDQIDHRDGDRLNNRWENFRQVSNGQNIQNSKLRSDNKTGVKGVSVRSVGNWKRYKAYISVNGKQRKLGLYRTLEEAAAVRASAAKQIYGEYARLA